MSNDNKDEKREEVDIDDTSVLDNEEKCNCEKEESNVEEAKIDIDKEVKENPEFELLRDQFVRLQADFSNYKRRTESEKKDYIEMGSRKVILELLQIIDNFERAISAESSNDKFYEGIKMIYKQLIDLIEKNGVVEIKAINEKFDPNIHHAVLVEQVDGVEEGIVIDVLQKGYMIGEKVLRSSMVKVSQ